MSELTDLDAARGLLATLEAGRSALLGLASAHLPFPRALRIHRAYAEGGVDLVAAEEAVTLRGELYWQAWRGAQQMVPEGATAPAPRAPAQERERVHRAPPEREVVRVAPPEREIVRVAPEPPPAEVIYAYTPPAAAAPVPDIVDGPYEDRPEASVAPPTESEDLATQEDAPAAPTGPAEAAWLVVDDPDRRPVDGQVSARRRSEPSPVRVIDPVTESPLLDEILRPQATPAPAAEASARRPKLPDFDQLPFEPISELDYVDDDASEVTQVAKVSTAALYPKGAPVPGERAGEPIPPRPSPELLVDDFNEISELEELEPGEFGLPDAAGPEPADPWPASTGMSALPISAHRADDEELLAQGDAPVLPEFDGANGDDLSVSFEMGAGLQKPAPRLTDEEEVARPAPAPRKDAAAEQALVQRALADAENAVARGDLARAVQFYSDALDVLPGNVEAHIGRGRTHLELGDYSSAMSDFQRAEDLSPNDPESHLAMGDLYYNRKEYKRAIDFYDEAVELDGQHAMAKCKRGLAHYYRKNFKQAVQDLQRAMALDPAIPNIHKYVQMALKKLDGKG